MHQRALSVGGGSHSRAGRKVGAMSTSNNQHVAIRSLLAVAFSCVGGWAGSASAESGDFAESCRGIYVYDSTLVAECKRVDGWWTSNELELNDYVTNNDGALRRRDDGDFAGSCDRIQVVQDGVLNARCRKIDGTWRRSSLDLNEFIANYDGELHVLGD